MKPFIAPTTLFDFVEYSSVSQSELEYDNNSGTFGEKSNVSDVTLDILYSPL